MTRKRPRLDYLRYVYSKRMRKDYVYFDTGRKKANGRPIFLRLPDPGSIGFHDAYAAALGHRNRQKVTAYTVADLLDEYQSSADFASKADGTRETYASAIRKLEPLHHFPADALTPQAVREFLDLSAFKAGTHNLVKAVLSAAFTWGRRRGKTDARPTADIEKQEGGSHEPWPQDLVDAALHSDNDTVRLATHLLYFTGQRIGDVCQLRWGAVGSGSVALRQQKTGKDLDVPLHSELADELARTPKRGIRILEGWTVPKLRKELQAWTREQGVETVPHGLRKNAVNSLLEAGCTIAEVASITGQTFAIVEHYAARVNQRKLGKAAVLKMEAHRRKA